MDDDNGNGDGLPTSSITGNPFVGDELCQERRGVMVERINNMEIKILSAVKLSAAVITIILSVVQLGLHFFGG